MGFYKYAKLAFFSKEAGDRQLFRLIKSQKSLRFVEFGIESLERTTKALSLAGDYAKQSKVQYAGFDPFDARSNGADSLSLIDAHRELSKLEASVRLVPGLISSGVQAMANTLLDTDMILIGQSVSDEALEPIWYYLPRMSHPGTQIIREDASEGAWNQIPLEEVSRLASVSRRAAA